MSEESEPAIEMLRRGPRQFMEGTSPVEDELSRRVARVKAKMAFDLIEDCDPAMVRAIMRPDSVHRETDHSPAVWQIVSALAALAVLGFVVMVWK